MDFNYGEITDKTTNCCDKISDPTPILVASRIAQNHDPIEAGSFVESWADEKLLIRSRFPSDRIVSGIGPWCRSPGYQYTTLIQYPLFNNSFTKRCSFHQLGSKLIVKNITPRHLKIIRFKDPDNILHQRWLYWQQMLYYDKIKLSLLSILNYVIFSNVCRWVQNFEEEGKVNTLSITFFSITCWQLQMTSSGQCKIYQIIGSWEM